MTDKIISFYINYIVMTTKIMSQKN